MQSHAETIMRTIHVVNLDPAAEVFTYQPLVDIRDLIHVDDAMEDEEMHYGPNGGLVFCMEFLLQNLAWLEEQLGEEIDEDYIIFDCPGQIELFTHLDVMRKFTDTLKSWNFQVCAIFLLDSHFMINSASFISGAMAALSAMTCLEVAFISVISKVDLLSRKSKQQLERFLDPDARDLLADEKGEVNSKWKKRHRKLTEAVGRVLEDYSLVKFVPLNIRDEDSLTTLLHMVDHCIQFGEDQDVKVNDFDPPEVDDDDGYSGDGGD